MARTHNKRYIALKRQRNRNIILNTVCAVFFLAGALWFARFFLNHLRYEMTNNAYVDQYIVPVNIRVSGFIREICFSEHQYVHRGDTLLVLDDREYKIRLQEAMSRSASQCRMVASAPAARLAASSLCERAVSRCCFSASKRACEAS